MGRRLYVGNLPYSTSEDQLTELFSRAGKVDNVGQGYLPEILLTLK